MSFYNTFDHKRRSSLILRENMNDEFWNALDELVKNADIVIDRPKGTTHPRFPNFVYKVDYGYLKETTSMDGAGIDVWVGTGEKKDRCNYVHC